MKKTFKIIITILIVLLLSLISFSIYMGIKLNNENQQLKKLKVSNIDIKKVKNGEFIGECHLDLKTANVKVCVKDGTIIKIDIIEHNHGPGYGADKIAQRIIDKQNLDVDAISGATKSSIVFKKAVENALKQGL